MITLIRQALGNKRADISDYFPRIEKVKKQRSGSFSALASNLKARNEALKASKKNG